MKKGKKWVAMWGCPIAKPSRNVAQWIYDTTVRFNIFTTVSGEALRFHFSNLFGSHPATITAATVSVSKGDRKIDLHRLAPITFSKNASVTMQAGENICSDEIPFCFAAGETLCVSLYFGEFSELTTAHQNDGKFIEKWAVCGNYTAIDALPDNENVPANCYPFIHTIDALCDEKCYSIVAFGDSITAQSWPDRLTRRIFELKKDNVTIIRKAISGGRVLREYPCTMYQTYGPKGIDRFAREVVQAGVKRVIVLHGINDIIHPGEESNPFRPITDLPTVEQLIDGLKKYIEIAHSNGIEIYLSTILPFQGWRTYTEEKNVIRMAVNDWIRNNDMADGVVDFEKAVMDTEDNNKMLAIYDSGDHLHPSAAGAQAMADFISETIL